jgi:anti-sigma regulatory factor (Ser/Thr protein kinase)
VSHPAGNDGGFSHEALFYTDANEFLSGTVPFVQQGIEAGEAVMVALPKPSLELLRGNLDGESDQVLFIEMEEFGRNPARLIPAWWDFLAASLRDRRGARGVGEPIWAGRSAPELEECRRHESLLNLAFTDANLSLLCPYDTVNLSDEVLIDAEHSHPALRGRDDRSAEFAVPADGHGFFAGELERPGGPVEELSFGEAGPGEVRRFVGERARRAGLESKQLEDLVLAANEIATNSIRHGGGHGTVSLWSKDGALVCDFRDSGRFEEPLAGRRRPSGSRVGGRGLWIANQLCDLVQIRSDEFGSLVRLRMAV